MNYEEAKTIMEQGMEFYSSGEYDKAFPLFAKSADAGFLPAYSLVGDCYWNGFGVDADGEKAIQCYLAAAKAGDPDGLMRIPDIFLRCSEFNNAVDCYKLAFEKG